MLVQFLDTKLLQFVIQFDNNLSNEFFGLQNKDDYFVSTNNKKPNITISLIPPKNIDQWEKHYIQTNFLYTLENGTKKVNDFNYIFYVNKNLDFYIQFLYYSNKIFTLFCIQRHLHNLMFIYNMLKRNILVIHGGLLNNGDIIFGSPLKGKSTLIQRLNKNNYYIFGLNSDVTILDLDKNKAYPLRGGLFQPLSYSGIKNRDVVFKRLLLKQIGQKQQIKQIDINQWKQIFKKDLINHDVSLSFTKYRGQYIEDPWINKFDLLRDIFYNRIDYLIDKLINENNLKPLVITTNTVDINNKCTLIEDKEQNICYFS